MLAPLNPRKCTFAVWSVVALSLFASCSSMPHRDSARITIAHPVNGSSSSGRSARLLFRCAGACDDRAAVVSFSNGESLQVHCSACILFKSATFDNNEFGVVDVTEFQVHASASVDVEDLPLGWNKISVELLAQDLSHGVLYGSALFRDEVMLFVRSEEEAAGPGLHGEEELRLLPPAAAIVIGRYSAPHVQKRRFKLSCLAHPLILLSTVQLSVYL